MGKTLNRLSARSVAAINKPGRHADGGGLYLVVTKTGTKNWVFLWKRAGKPREMGLGSVRSVPLTKARELATNARAIVADGLDPIEERGKSRKKERLTPTFGKCADDYIESIRPSLRNPKHIKQWETTLSNYCTAIHSKPVDEITTDDILAVLKPHWLRVPETAARLRGRIERVLDAAKALGYRQGENPARWRGHLDHLLPARKNLDRSHHKALAYKAVPEFLRDLRNREGIAARMLEFIILTAARTGEVRLATWREIDTEKALWVIPAERTKQGREHREPLTPRALEILQDMAKISYTDDEGRFVFPGVRPKRPLSVMATEMVLRRMAGADGAPKQWTGITTHGFRSSFRDWCAEETAFPREIAEAALSHTVGDKTEQAYRRGDALEKRRELMTAWGRYCAGNYGENVVRLRS